MSPDIQALLDIGIDLDAEVRAIRAAADLDIAQRLLTELKDRARKAFRRAAATLHPDRNGGDDVKTGRFIVLSRAVATLCKVELRDVLPSCQPTVWTSRTCARPYSVWRVVHLRPL